MIGRDVFLLDAAREATDDEVLTSFLEQYYAARGVDPARGLRAGRPSPRPPTSRRSSPSAAAARSTSASRSAARSASCWRSRPATRPRRSRASRRAGWPTRARRSAALEELAEALGLPGPPLRIECYDISNFQGSESVGSMVVFEDGKPRTGEYRRFRIKTVEGPNDFASHQEVLRRRFRLASGRARRAVEEARRWAMPDLVIIDGGKGQVSAAKEVLDELGLHDLPLAGLAKEREELFLPGPRPTRSCCRRRRRRSTSSSACATRRIGSRSPTTATCGRKRDRPLGVRRPARRRAEAQARAAQGLRLDQAGPRRAGRADRRGARDRAGARGADQGDARGLTRGTAPSPIASSSSFRPPCSLPTGRYGQSDRPARWAAPPEGMPPDALRSPS